MLAYLAFAEDSFNFDRRLSRAPSKLTNKWRHKPVVTARFWYSGFSSLRAWNRGPASVPRRPYWLEVSHTAIVKFQQYFVVIMVEFLSCSFLKWLLKIFSYVSVWLWRDLFLGLWDYFLIPVNHLCIVESLSIVLIFLFSSCIFVDFAAVEIRCKGKFVVPNNFL